ncbi:SMEK domain-containing protein [Archangium lipolyticum]|uniref:SMEK domain-containing protein n=1 Tax=Archangium lipolyticum TaxID=2970465 RepID=UPI002149A6E9|nr:SMEK domain-containing protein [Archangium lipolyticum]
MITRGYFIGEIVDGLSDIAHQVDTRTKLGLTDLNLFVENFFKTALNLLLDINLENMNQERSNFPGLDLADVVKGWAFQITSQKTSAKVNETLTKITDDQLRDYTSIRVLVVGKKQSTYSLDDDQKLRTGFTEGNVLDVDDLCKLAMDLPIDRLQSLYDHVRKETASVKIDLEVPDEEGKYPTTIYDYIEKIPQPKLSDFARYAASEQVVQTGLTREAVEKDFRALAAELAKLPRITREFFAVLIERRDDDEQRHFGDDRFRVNTDRLKRILRYPDLDGELRILQAHRFVDYREPDQHGDSGHWRLFFPGTSEYFHFMVDEFLKKRGLSWRRPIVDLDFSEF